MPKSAAPAPAKPHFPGRIMHALSGILTHPFTVIAAPAGAGKTTCLRHYFARSGTKPVQTLWYTAFGESRASAWERICALLAGVDADTAGRLGEIGFPVRENLSLLVEQLHNFHAARNTVLVLDNAHLLGVDDALEVIGVLARHGCANFHMVVLTQTPLADIPETLLIDPSILFFRERDIAAFFRLNGHTLSQAQVQQVLRHTSGWVAALHIQLQGYRQTGKIQSEGGIHRLLGTALWNHLSQKEQALLFALSLMESASEQQVFQLLGEKHLPPYAFALIERGCFSSARRNNRFHMAPLLREYAQLRFAALPPDKQKAVYARTGRAHALEGAYMPACRCLLHAGEYEAMLRLPVGDADMSEYNANEVVELLADILAACPRPILAGHPHTLVRFAFELLLRGREDLYTQYCAILEGVLDAPGLLPKPEQQRLFGEYTFLRSFTLYNDIAKMHVAHKTALAALGGPSSALVTNRYWSFGIPSVLTQYWRPEGRLKQQVNLLARTIPAFNTLAGGYGTGAAELMRAEAVLQAGSLDNAESLCHKTLYLAGKESHDGVCFGAHLLLGRIAVLRGDVDAYAESLASIRQLAQMGTERQRGVVADLCTASLSLTLGHTDDIPAWLCSDTGVQAAMYEPGQCYGLMLYGRYLLLRGEYNKLFGISGVVLDKAERQHLALVRIYYLIYLACAKRAAGSPKEALDYCERALHCALPDHVYLPFAEHAPLLLGLLEKTSLAQDSRTMGRLERLCRRQEAGVAKINKTLHAPRTALTRRETEIALLAKRGFTNKEIAGVLFISPETVKKTLKNIFVKLDIQSRRQLMDRDF